MDFAIGCLENLSQLELLTLGRIVEIGVPVQPISRKDKFYKFKIDAVHGLLPPFEYTDLEDLTHFCISFLQRLRSGEIITDRKRNFFKYLELEVDFLTTKTCLDGQEIHLTPVEYKLLCALIRNQGRVLNHSQLLAETWGPGYDDPHVLRVNITRLREKLHDPHPRKYVCNKPNFGYFMPKDRDQG